MDGMNWRRLIAVGGMASLGFVAACSSEDDPDGGTTPTDTGIRPDGGTADTGIRPDSGTADAGPTDTGPSGDAGFVKVNFTIDDTANRIYDEAGGLAWKGSFAFDNTTRVMTKTGWTGPFAKVWDDGPVSTGGHEPEGATAGDNRWGIEALVPVPAADEMFEYGAISGSVNGSDGNWIWSLQHPSNGTFTVPASGGAAVTAEGLTLPAFGTVDFRLSVDTSTLAPEFATFDPANGISVKSSGWGWSEQGCLDNGMAGDVTSGDDVFTFQLGENVGPGKPLRYSGKLKSGDVAQFVFVLGGVEYKVAGAASAQGITAEVRAQGAANWTVVPIESQASGDRNTFITVP